MAYSSRRGNKPFEQAGRANHSSIINSPAVQAFISKCQLPRVPEPANLDGLLHQIDQTKHGISAVIAVDGGMTESFVREQFPSASIAFLNLGPLFFNLADLRHLDQERFIAPEDMARLKNLQRYQLVVPTKTITLQGRRTFSEGVRASIHDFLVGHGGTLLASLAWLLFKEWLPAKEQQRWEIPQCPNADCTSPGVSSGVSFGPGEPFEKKCSKCGGAVFLADALRLYERIDDEHGASGILGYLLTAVESILIVDLIRSVLTMKRELMREVLFIKDGPLAFFGTTAPLHKPMRALMLHLKSLAGGDAPLINLVGVEKSGPFVEHAAQIEKTLPKGSLLVLNDEYIYRYIQPGDPKSQSFGRNTYYGGKAIFRGYFDDTHVITVPTGDHNPSPWLDDLYNVREIVQVVSELRCSMYDNALLPVSLANRLVSLADMPSSEILTKFVRNRLSQ